MEKKYIIYIIIVFIVFVVFMPVYLTPKPDMCVGQAQRIEEVSLSYAEINKHENTIQDKIISGDTSTYITVSIYNIDSNSGDFLIIATFTPILNLDMSLLNKLTKDTINFDSKFLREEKRSTTVLIPSHSTRDVTIRFDSPLYQVSKHEIIPPKKNVTITEQINFPCQKQVYITYFQKVIE